MKLEFNLNKYVIKFLILTECINFLGFFDRHNNIGNGNVEIQDRIVHFIYKELIPFIEGSPSIF